MEPAAPVASQLQVSVGQHACRGRKATNQDFHGAYVPDEPLLTTKGVAVALADGISSSEMGRVASESAVHGFLVDYYCTPETWSVKTSVQRVLSATNSWLYAQTQRGQGRYDKDRGYVCTFSGLVLKSATAHLFHVGDSRIYRLSDDGLEQLTQDHRIVLAAEESYLSRALGVDSQLDLDYRTLTVAAGDVFLLATDGVYEHLHERSLVAALRESGDDLDRAAASIVGAAYARGSADNLTAQIVRVDALPVPHLAEVRSQLSELPSPPVLDARSTLDGYTIVRELHASSRSHIYLAVDGTSGGTVVIKAPSIDRRDDPAYLERFLLEEWVARRIDNAHVLRARPPDRKRSHLYTVMDFMEGQTLRQWMIDHPKPDMETVRGIVEQIARGLQAFHRLEMLHQDLRPDNVMIDATGTVKIIDFGSTRVAGLAELAPVDRVDILGTAQYTAPEYFLGESGTARSDLFSLGVITYQMLCGRLPYGANVARARTRSAQRKLRYGSVLDDERDIPAWIDDTLEKAVRPDPDDRQQELSEFLYDLRQPSQPFVNRSRRPLLERNPLAFWKGLSLALAVVIVLLLTLPS